MMNTPGVSGTPNNSGGQWMKFDAGNNRYVELQLSHLGAQPSSPLRQLNAAKASATPRGPFCWLRQALKIESCMSATAVNHRATDVRSVADDSSVYSVGGLVECLMDAPQSDNIQAVSVQSSRMKEVHRPFLPSKVEFQGEFFNISDLKEDICKFLAVKPALRARFDIPMIGGQVRFADIPREFFSATFEANNSGVPASDIFSTLRALEHGGNTHQGPSNSLKRYMLCQLLSIQDIKSNFEERSFVDSLEDLYDPDTEIGAELYGFIANDDAKDSMGEYLREASITARLDQQELKLSPVNIIKRLGKQLLSTKGTGIIIGNEIDPIRRTKARLKQELTESDKKVDEIVKLILHGPGGGDAQAALMAIGSPIPKEKMGLAAALVFDVTRTFPNPDLNETQKYLVGYSTRELSEKMKLFHATGKAEFTSQDNENARAFLLGHGLINEENIVEGPKGPVTGHYDSVYFSNSKEGSLEHMLKKAMLVNAIMALGKENIINKSSANELLNAVFTNQINQYYQSLLEIEPQRQVRT